MASQYMTCPSGGTFFACTDKQGGFIGCCDTADACSASGCGDGAKKPTGFQPAHANDLHDQKCSDPTALFYSCSSGSTFWGCCKVNPCQQAPVGCPQVSLVQAFLGSNPADYAIFVNSSSTTTASSSTASSTRSGSSTNSSLTGSTTATIQPQTTFVEKSKTSIAVIVGPIIGGILVISAVIALFFILRKRKQKSTAVPETSETQSARYSQVPTLAHREYFASPKSGFTGSPDPNKHSSSYTNTPSLGHPSPYHSGVSEGQWQDSRYYAPSGLANDPHSVDGRLLSHQYDPPVEIGGGEIPTVHEMSAEQAKSSSRRQGDFI